MRFLILFVACAFCYEVFSQRSDSNNYDISGLWKLENTNIFRYYNGFTKGRGALKNNEKSYYYIDINESLIQDKDYLPIMGYQIWDRENNLVEDFKVSGINTTIDTIEVRMVAQSFLLDTIKLQKSNKLKQRKIFSGKWIVDSIYYNSSFIGNEFHAKSSQCIDFQFNNNSNFIKITINESGIEKYDYIRFKYFFIEDFCFLITEEDAYGYNFSRIIRINENSILLLNRISYPPDNFVKGIYLKKSK